MLIIFVNKGLEDITKIILWFGCFLVYLLFETLILYNLKEEKSE